MDKLIVHDKELSKADALVLKNLEADIRDVAAKGPSQSHNGHASGTDVSNGNGNGHAKAAANGSTPIPRYMMIPPEALC